MGFPISTTHGLTGAIVGVGLVAVGTKINLQSLGRGREAAVELEQALRDDPLSFASRLQRALCLMTAELYDEAEAEMRRVLELNRVYQGFYFLSLNYASRGNMPEALKCAEQAVSLAPQNPHSRAVLAAPFVSLFYRSVEPRPEQAQNTLVYDAARHRFH